MMNDATKPVPSVRAALTALLHQVDLAAMQYSSAPHVNVEIPKDAIDAAFDALAAPFGLALEQESKYTTCPDTGAIINRATGQPIPSDEPIMIFRAKDVYAREITRRYFDLVHDNGKSRSVHGDVCFERHQKFIDFADRHLEKMRTPD